MDTNIKKPQAEEFMVNFLLFHREKYAYRMVV